MAKITRIKAKDTAESTDDTQDEKKVVKIRSKSQPESSVQEKAKNHTEAEKTPKKRDNTKKPFILIRPFVYFSRYVRDSWREIRQVRWPSRKATWKLFFAIVVYTLLFVGIIMLLDAIFTWLFETVIG